MDREHALMIVKCYKEAILPLLANAKVYLYGSCSRNEARKDSDIDVAVVIPKLNGDWLDTTSSLWLDIGESVETSTRNVVFCRLPKKIRFSLVLFPNSCIFAQNYK